MPRVPCRARPIVVPGPRRAVPDASGSHRAHGLAECSDAAEPDVGRCVQHALPVTRRSALVHCRGTGGLGRQRQRCVLFAPSPWAAELQAGLQSAADPRICGVALHELTHRPRAAGPAAELGFNSTNSGQWIQPDLFYTFQTVVPFSGDTIEFIMIDTLSLIGGVNAQPDVLPALYYPPPAPSGYVARAAAVAAGPAAAAATRAGAATYGAAVYGAATAAAPAAAPGAAVTYTAAMSPTISPYATAAAPTAGALGSVYGHRRAGARRMSQIANMAVSAGGMDNPRAQPYDLGYVPPEVNEAQWNWVSAAINSSYADWIIVVGNHPVWSVGEYGPTWSLVDKLAPMMEASGVALYIGGKDHSLQHFMPVPSTNNVDYIVAGNGAYGNDTTAHAGDCPYGALQFSYASGTGFVQIKISHAEANVPGLMKVTFYDDTGTSLYSFYKENPRTVAGHTIGNLGAPPSPSPLNANADSGGPMVIISGMFIVLAVSMGLWIIASHALTNMGYRGPGMRGMPGAYGLPGEKTPLVPGHGPVVNL